jgi:hypothetical protein
LPLLGTVVLVVLVLGEVGSAGGLVVAVGWVGEVDGELGFSLVFPTGAAELR